MNTVQRDEAAVRRRRGHHRDNAERRLEAGLVIQSAEAEVGKAASNRLAQHVLVHRLDLRVYHRELGRREYEILIEWTTGGATEHERSEVLRRELRARSDRKLDTNRNEEEIRAAAAVRTHRHVEHCELEAIVPQLGAAT